ncbi:MAG: energy-coupling factor transporter transmembrane component T [Cyanobacteria bacterium P01_A01_bin.84]
MTNSVPVLYRERNTFLHQRDPRVKIFLFFLLFLFLFIAPNWQWLLLLAIIGIVLAAVAQTPWKWLVVLWAVQIPSLLVIIGIPVVKQLLSDNFEFSDDIISAFRLLLAWSAAIFISLSLFSTMDADDLTHGLRGLKVPAIAAFAVGLSYRLLYVTLTEAFQIADAMKIKGVDLETKNIFRLIKNSLKLSLPILFAVLRRGPTLMSALEMRGFIQGKRGRHLGKLDLGDLGFLFAFIALFGCALGERVGVLPSFF